MLLDADHGGLFNDGENDEEVCRIGADDRH